MSYTMWPYPITEKTAQKRSDGANTERKTSRKPPGPTFGESPDKASLVMNDASALSGGGFSSAVSPASTGTTLLIARAPPIAVPRAQARRRQILPGLERRQVQT